MMRCKSSLALAYSSRAASPYWGCSKICGNFPFSSQATKRNVQSIYEAISPAAHHPAATARKRWPRMSARTPLDLQSSGKRCVVRDQSALAPSRRQRASAHAHRDSPDRRSLAVWDRADSATTPTAREASSTCTVLWLNWGDLHGRMLGAGRRPPISREPNPDAAFPWRRRPSRRGRV